MGFVKLVPLDRKSTRLNSSHLVISYAVFCLKQKTVADRSGPRPHGARARRGSRSGARGGRPAAGGQARRAPAPHRSGARARRPLFFFSKGGPAEIDTVTRRRALRI